MQNVAFTVTIRTPENELFKGEVFSLYSSSEGGDVEIMAQHASMTASLTFSPLVLKMDDDLIEEFVVRNGLLFFDNKTNTATVLALHAQKKSEVSLQTVKEYLTFVEEKLAAGEELSEFQVKFLEGEKLSVERQLKEVEA